jgi:hypothetical protein
MTGSPGGTEPERDAPFEGLWCGSEGELPPVGKREKKWRKVGALVWLLAELVVVFVFVNAVNWTFHNKYCNFLLVCGCTWNWAGSWDQCNIHDPDPAVPKCPWCAASGWSIYLTEYAVMLSMAITYYLIAYWRVWLSLFRCASPLSQVSGCSPHLPSVGNLIARVVGPFAAFGISGFVVGLAFYLATDYPYFIFS